MVRRKPRVIPVSAALAAVALAAACGDGSTGPAPPMTVPNRAPATVGTISDLTLSAGDTESVDVSSYFNDPDGDGLSYTAETSDAEVATTSVSGSTVTVTGVAAGMATVTVTASDPGGLSASQSFEVTVLNRAPEAVGTIPDLTLRTGDTENVDVSSYFNDPDADALIYAATSSDAGVATASVSGSTVTLHRGGGVGVATITVTASDPGGLSASQSFRVTGPEALTIRPGDAVLLSASKRMSWKTDNPAVVAIDTYAPVIDDTLVYMARVVGLTDGVALLTTDEEGVRPYDVLIENQIYGDYGPLFVTTGRHVEVTVASPMTGYPIHMNYLGDVPEVLRWGMETAAAVWSQILAPTPAASFTFDERWEWGWDRSRGIVVTFEAGETLPPGLHTYVSDNSENMPEHVLGRASLFSMSYYGTSDVPMEPAGLIELNAERFNSSVRVHSVGDAEFFRRVHEVALHEIAHLLGIGTGDRWASQVEVPDPEKPFHSWFIDPEAIAAFDRMGGTDFPWKKIPLDLNSNHWDGCAGHGDLMAIPSATPISLITELTMASLAEGYTYDWTLAPKRKLNPEIWNGGHGVCRNGIWDLYDSPSSFLSSGSFSNDVILPDGR